MADVKAKNRTRRSRPRRRDPEVLDAAARVFHQRGYAAASVQDIADELGILKGSLYHYIDTKEDLLFRLIEELHTETDAILQAVLDEPGLTPLDRLSIYVRKEVAFSVRHSTQIAIYYRDLDQLSDGRRAVIVERRALHERFVSSMLREAQKQGDVRAAIDPQAASNLLFGAMIWTYQWYSPGGKLSPEAVGEACADFVMHGVAARGDS
jgi:TetR/AcrR family transcriptional regulator, cholesterol catabolism regulator